MDSEDETTKTSRMHCIQETFKNQDAYGPNIQLNYPDGESSHRTVLGGCLSWIAGLLTFAFLLENTLIWWERSGTLFL